MIEDKDFLKNCSMVKTFLMLLVVLGHSCLFWGGGWASPMKPIISCHALGVFAAWLNSFHIYAFVLVSGYLFYYVKFERRNEKYLSVKKHLHNKFRRLIVPYVATSFFWVIPLSLCVGVFGSSTDFVAKFVFGKSPSQLWFLLMLFGVFVFSYFFADLWKRNNLFGLTIAIVFYFIGICGMKLDLNYFQFFSSCTYLICFFSGFKIRQYPCLVQKLLRFPLLLWIVIDVSLFAVSLYSIPFFSQIICKIMLSCFLHIWGAVGAFVVLHKLLLILPAFGQIFFASISKYTMPIYLLHQQIVYVVIYYLNGLVNPYINAMANFIISLTLSTLMSVVLMRFKLTRFLIGEK